MLFAGNGRQAIAAALAALSRPAGRIGIEAMTYPVAAAIAVRLGLIPVPLEMDGEGVLPAALAAAHRAAPLMAFYVQPSLNSPLGTTMGTQRREELAAVLRATRIVAIEDGVYSFLADSDVPLAAFAPDQVIMVDGLSKRVAPGSALGC